MADERKRLEDLEKLVQALAAYVYEQIPKLKYEIGRLHEQYNDANSKADDALRLKDRIDSSSREIDSILNKFMTYQKDLGFKLNDIDSIHDQMKKEIVSKENQQSNFDNLSNLKESVRMGLKNLESGIDIKLSVFKEFFEVKLDEIKSTFDMKPEDIDHFKREVMKKVDLVALDGTNSILRTQVAEQQLKIIEKKIENIYLLLKKHELNQ